MPEYGNDQLDDPGFKLWLRNQGGRRGGPGLPSPGAGGGYGSFFGMPGQAPQGNNLGVRQTRRRIGFQPMLGASQPSAPSTVTQPQSSIGTLRAQTVAPSVMSGSYGRGGQAFTGEGVATPQATSPYGQSGLTAEQEQLIARLPSLGGAREATRKRFLEANQKAQQAAANADGNGSEADWDRLLNNTDTNWGGIQARLLGAAGQAGLFSPGGSPMMAESIRQRGIADAGAREAKARTAAALAGGNDPSMRGVAELMASLGAAGDASTAASEAELAQLMQQRGFLQNMLKDYFRMHSENFLSQQNRPQNQGGSFWNDLLDIVGQALGG